MSLPLLTSTIHHFAEAARPCLHYLADAEKGKWQPISCAEFKDSVLALAAGLLKLGVEVQQCVGIFSENRPEVLMTHFAAWQIRALTVGIYATSSVPQAEFIVRDSGMQVLVVGSQSHYDSARQTGVKTIVAIDPEVKFDADDHTSITFSQLLKLGTEAEAKRVDKIYPEAEEDDLATLIYTSGTTGQSKGAMLTQGNFSACLTYHRQCLTSLTQDDTSLNFLPLSHIFEMAWSCFCIYMGIPVYVNQDPHRVQQSLRETHPSCMCSVPRFWEKVYTAVREKQAKMGLVTRTMMKRALKVGIRRNLQYVRHGLKVPALLEREYQMYNKRIFRKVRSVIGVERGNIFPTAGAPLADDIVAFCHGIGINIVIGYGLSETTATVSFYPYKDYAIGSVGRPLPELDVKIGPDNEILVKGATVMTGYYNRPEQTEEVFTADGYFRTGDAGRLDDEGNLYLTERIKDLFKTSNGKYIAPQALESRLSSDTLFDQVAVIGDQRKFVSALIVPDYAALEKFAKEHKLGDLTREELATNPRVIEHVQGRIEALTSDLAHYEQIKRFTLLTTPFTIENGELTNTLKVRRRAVADRYKSVIDKMYEE